MKTSSLLIYIIIILFNITCISSVKVAIIGADTAGAISAYYLKNLNKNIEIYVYDHVPVKIDPYTGFIVHPDNKYANEIIEIINLKMGPQYQPDSASPVIYDKFRCEPLTKFQSALKLLKPILEDFKKNFQKIYEKIQKGTFETVAELLKSINPVFDEYSKKSINEIILGLKIEKEDLKIVEKLITAYLMKSSLSDMNANAFFSLMYIAYFSGAEVQKNSESDFNNKKIITDLLQQSGAEMVYRYVTKISRHNNGGYSIISKGHRDTKKDKPANETYDFVILATNATKDILFDKPITSKFFVKFIDFNVHWIKGELLNSCVRLGEVPKKVPYLIDFSNSLVIMKMEEGGNLDYCIFKKDTLDSSFYKKFIDIHWDNKRFIYGKTQLCPNYSDHKLVDGIRFVLADNLYNVRAVESVFMSIEMLAISANNIAMIIKKKCDEPQMSKTKFVGSGSKKEDVQKTKAGKSVVIASDSKSVKCNPKLKFPNLRFGVSKSEPKQQQRKNN